MKIAVGSDERTPVTDSVVDHLRRAGAEVELHGPLNGKVAGIRAALCGDAQTARGARKWNDANVLAMSLRATPEAVAKEICDAWLETGPDEAERATIAKVER
ncbi:MAG: RpiB/LacA/LacB family sugar-phosphate isomerase [Deltaproteobacteria bacterium]|nr:MAG: RpiB/LacA/LacB family sugar-phosphate isomerase [Deltaproteobacteria bacterium]